MKRILITGANSYIGISFEKWISKWPDAYQVDTVDMIGDGWRELSFSGYDAIVHVAGIAHQKESRKNASLYSLVNRDLTVSVAQKAKSEGIRQFIFLSTMSVYGMNSGTITTNTIPDPKSLYGQSKYEAEKALVKLFDSAFLLAIIRPPMVYGPGCKGNYQQLSKLVKKISVFPKIENQRSMIFIDHLCEFIRNLIDNRGKGVFFPQNDQYVCTMHMVQKIADNSKREMLFLPHMQWLLKLMAKHIGLVDKIFGSLIYEKTLSGRTTTYCSNSFEETIQITERKQ